MAEGNGLFIRFLLVLLSTSPNKVNHQYTFVNAGIDAADLSFTDYSQRSLFCGMS